MIKYQTRNKYVIIVVPFLTNSFRQQHRHSANVIQELWNGGLAKIFRNTFAVSNYDITFSKKELVHFVILKKFQKFEEVEEGSWAKLKQQKKSFTLTGIKKMRETHRISLTETYCMWQKQSASDNILRMYQSPKDTDCLWHTQTDFDRHRLSLAQKISCV